MNDQELERLRRFLLGEMPEDEMVAVEDGFLTDDDGFAMVESVEDDLIDGYVRGELSEERRRRFEKRFLATASQRARVVLAQALATRAAAPPRRRRAPLLYRAAAAAALVGAVGLVGSRLLAPGVGPVVDEVLFPSTLRGDGAPATMRLPANASRVRLHLRLTEPLPDDAETVDVVLQHETGAPRTLPATRAADGTLLVTSAADALGAGVYELTARAHRRGGAVQEVGIYLIRVEAR